MNTANSYTGPLVLDDDDDDLISPIASGSTESAQTTPTLAGNTKQDEPVSLAASTVTKPDEVKPESVTAESVTDETPVEKDPFWDEDSLVTNTPAPTPAPAGLSELASEWGLSQLPSTPDAWKLAVQEQANSIAQRVIAGAQNPEREQLSEWSKLDDEGILRAKLRAEAEDDPTSDEDDIEDKIQKWVDKDQIGSKAARLRSQVTARIGQIDSELDNQSKAARENEARFYESVSNTTRNYKDPLGQPLTPKIQNEILDYVKSGRYRSDVLEVGPERLVEIAIMVHSGISKGFEQRKIQNAIKQGKSDILKRMDHQVQPLPTGAAPPKPAPDHIGSDDVASFR